MLTIPRPRLRSVLAKPGVASTLDTASPLSTGLICCLLFNEGTGNRITDLVTGASTQVTSGVNWSVNDNGGTCLYAASNPGQDWAVFPVTPGFTLGSGAGTILARFNITSHNGNERIVCFGTNQTWQWLWNSTDNTMSAYQFNGGFQQSNTGGVGLNPTLGAWYTAGYTFDPVGATGQGSLRFYSNGVRVGGTDQAAPAASNTDQALHIGGDTAGGSSDNLIGYFDWLYIWNRTLTPDEISAITADPYQVVQTRQATTFAILANDSTVSPSGVPSGQALGTPTVTAVGRIFPGGVVSGEAFGTPTIGTLQNLSPSGVTSREAFGTPTIGTLRTVSPSGVPSGQALGTPAVRSVISPIGVPSGQALGTPTVTARKTLSPSGVVSGAAFGTPTMTGGRFDQTVTATGIDSGEAFGDPEYHRLDIPPDRQCKSVFVPPEPGRYRNTLPRPPTPALLAKITTCDPRYLAYKRHQPRKPGQPS
jgi:hypothetical protein